MDIILTAIAIFMVMFVAYELGQVAVARFKKEDEPDTTPVSSNRARAILQ